MTLDEFEFMYAEKSGYPLETLKALGMHGVPCSCGEDGCMGYVMASEQPEQDVEAALERLKDYQSKLKGVGT